MKRNVILVLSIPLFAQAFLAIACQQKPASAKLQVVAQSYELWTGVAVSKDGRIFVNYPRWTMAETTSVAEIVQSNMRRPFPDERWNTWDPSLPPGQHLICVQSVYIDDEDNLWILDPASPGLRGVVAGGAKLLKVDLRSDRVVQQISFDSTVAPLSSYLNDVRIDTKRQFAYITDSGIGAIIVVNLATGEARRVLDTHPSTKAENTTFVVEGITLRAKIHSDGLALDPSREYLYYKALTGHSLYKINTRWLRDFSLPEEQLAEHVELVGKTGVADGIEFAKDGNLYLTSLEYNAVRRLTPGGNVEVVVQDSSLKWPDALSIADDGTIYVTTSQLHLGARRVEPYCIFKFKPVQ